MIVRPARADDRREVFRMRRALWPDSEEHEVQPLIDMPADEGVVLVAERPEGGLSAFAEVGHRKFADGCDSSPVAYLEGIWVDPDVRRSGVGAAIVSAAEAWATGHGFTEFASDCEITNDASYAFHLGVGFEEVTRSICFRRALGKADEASG